MSHKRTEHEDAAKAAKPGARGSTVTGPAQSKPTASPLDALGKGALVGVGAADVDGVVFEITDTGIGMSAERLAMLSQPFAFSEAALARQHGGAGLGIAIARAIAELSGGRLAIDSRPALGTTVAISLPLTEALPSSARQHAA